MIKQEKAAKLSTCVCDGSEDYDCPSILDNMDRLCYHKVRPSTSIASSTVATTPSHHQIAGEGSGPGVEEHNDTKSGDGRTEHGHHPGHQSHQHPKARPHHPHHSTAPDIECIDTNEVEIQPPAHLPSRACSLVAQLFLLALLPVSLVSM